MEGHFHVAREMGQKYDFKLNSRDKLVSPSSSDLGMEVTNLHTFLRMLQFIYSYCTEDQLDENLVSES